MCGIAGIWDAASRLTADAAREALLRMTDAVRHRGPDDSGVWQDAGAGLTLGHRRLSILDLSAQGHQPMVSASGRYVIVFNGEIYNFSELRDELEKAGQAPSWRGHSDTEVLLACFEAWGPATALPRLNGMFAMGVWDRSTRLLTLIRDRMGKKPLFYGWSGGVFLFASEIKAIKAAGFAPMTINRSALPLLLRYNYIPSPHSIYDQIHKLQPACSLELNEGLGRDSTRVKVDVDEPGSPVRRYWSAREMIEAGSREPVGGSTDDVLAELDSRIRKAVSMRMVADVPLGAFLSGGVDSSLVVALMQAQSARPIRTFSIGYNEENSDEAVFARAVARHLGTEHTEWYMTGNEALDLVPSLPAMSDEPHGDTAIIPTYLVSKLARRDVTVAISGDGGDELFAGYPRYLWLQDRWKPEQARFRWAGSAGRVVLSRAAGWPVLKVGLGDLDRALRLESPEAVYRDWVFHWSNPSDVLMDAREPRTVVTNPVAGLSGVDPVQRMVFLDFASRLPDSIVAKVDRTSMQVSLEVRAPLLDYQVAEFAARIPVSLKLRGGRGKWILRELLHRYVPREMVDRPKKGFKMPIGEWLRGPLREWAQRLLDPLSMRQDGYFREEVVTRLWQDHLAGLNGGVYRLWDVLMFQAWKEAVK